MHRLISAGDRQRATSSQDGHTRKSGSASVRPPIQVDILGVRARVECSPALARQLRSLFPVAPTWTQAFQTLPGATVHVRVRPTSPGLYELTCDGEPVWQTHDAEDIPSALEWIVSTATADRLRERLLLLHAGSVTYGESGLVFPAASGSGKTTLVAGLLAAGFRYVNDDITVVDPDSYCLVPFATSLCVKEGSWQTLAPLYPASLARLHASDSVNASATSSHPWRTGPPAQFRFGTSSPPDISLELKRRWCRSHGRPVSSAWPSRWFSPPLRRAEDFEGILAMVGEADCYDLVVGNLRQATELLLALISDATAHGSRRDKDV